MSNLMVPDLSLGTALVVDDVHTNRALLQRQLERLGYKVLTASNGQEAIAQFAAGAADLVFLDVMLPDMDGYEVARHIKTVVGTRFVPIIFLTSLSEDEALAKCIAAGGDDFLSKPLKPTILGAKVAAIERIRGLYARMQAQHAELNVLHDQMQRDQEIAEQVFSSAVMEDNAASTVLQSLLRSTDTFNGDIMLSAYTPSGSLCVLLGDFTGHGLAAAIGALPMSETFRAMISKGFGLHEVLAEINRKLRKLLPTGMFMACCVIKVDPDLQSAVVWNSGMPDMLVLHGEQGRLRHRVRSMHPPLGAIARFLPDCEPQRIDIQAGDVILLCSDGVTEARNSAGEQFGEQRLDEVIAGHPPGEVFDAVVAALGRHMDGATQDDDISLVLIPCRAELFERVVVQTRDLIAARGSWSPSPWRWALSLHGANLRQIDPVPIAISQLGALELSVKNRQQLFVVLAELYNNALDHGVLGLSSALKYTPDGFTRYHSERRALLEKLGEGYVSIALEYRHEGGQGVVIVRVEDSGVGFSCAELEDPNPPPACRVCGRGILLVRSLCRSVSFNVEANCVEAEYVLE